MTTRLLLAILVVLSLAASGCSSGRNSCLGLRRHSSNYGCNCNNQMPMYGCNCGTCNSCPYGSSSMGGCNSCSCGGGCSSCSDGGCSSCSMGGCSSCSMGGCSSYGMGGCDSGSCSSCASGGDMMMNPTSYSPGVEGSFEGAVEVQQTPTPAPPTN